VRVRRASLARRLSSGFEILFGAVAKQSKKRARSDFFYKNPIKIDKRSVLWPIWRKIHWILRQISAGLPLGRYAPLRLGNGVITTSLLTFQTMASIKI
jgi:hypothetical protein